MREEWIVSILIGIIGIASWQGVKYYEMHSPIEIEITKESIMPQESMESMDQNRKLNKQPSATSIDLSKEKLPPKNLPIPAFPDAKGGGAGAKGGRGGKVYFVTNLHDRGVGSLRYGLEKIKGARTIIFRVGGYIHLDYPIVVNNDGFITIAGQTAPGDGITLTTVNSKEPVLIFRHTHDIILRYLRIRKGGTKAHGQHGSGLVISRGGENIMVDHCSVSWTGDDNINIWANASGKEGLRNITIQNSISAEGLNYGHPGTSLIVGGSAHVEKMKDISIHHNLFANNKNRNPLLKVATGDIVNNIIYNWSWWATGIGGGIKVDIIANRYKAGPITTKQGRGEIVFKPYNPLAKRPEATGVEGDPSIYFRDNVGPHNPDWHQDGWEGMMERVNNFWGYPVIDGKPTRCKLSTQYRRKSPRYQPYPIHIDRVSDLEEKLLASHGVGASQRLGADGSWIDNRDLVDQRIIREYYENQGKLVQTVDDVGGWVVYKEGIYSYIPEKKFIQNLKRYQLNGGKPYQDSDKDGMPDIWEDRYHLNKHKKEDAIEDRDGDGYDNLEEFLNGTKP
jgi:pectate lyase